MHSFDDPGITSRLPHLYRTYAWYSRRACDCSTGHVRGGSFLLSALIGVTRTFRLTGEAAVKVGDLTVYLDFCDHHLLDRLVALPGRQPAEI